MNVDADRRVLLQVADMSAIVVGAAIDEAKVIVVDQTHRIADGRVVGNAALKLSVRPDLADHVEAGNAAIGERIGIDLLFGDFSDEADDGGRASGNSHEAPDGDL